MKIFLTDQTKYLAKHLDRLKLSKVMKYDRSELVEKVTAAPLTINAPLSRLDLGFLFGYKIFPANIMTYLTQWEHENREMRTGDTIVQQVFLPPVKTFSQKIIFGVRISEIIDRDDVRGFSYETLDGHVEKGISAFTFEQNGQETIFKVHTFSSPANILTKLLGPVFSVPYQTYCTGAAIRNVKSQVEKNDQ